VRAWSPVRQRRSALTELKANVDEVFIDLCRQMLRKDDDYLASNETDDSGFNFDALRGGNKRKRRMRLRDRDHPRCVIL
jgi:hypothetical protein